MSHTHRFQPKDVFALGFLLGVALLLRLYHITAPVADWHSWRQVDTAAVARNFVEGDFDLMHPKFDDFSNVQTGKYNPEGLRFVEFPLYNASFALLYKIAPVVTLEVYGRIVTIFFSLMTLISIYYLLYHEVSRPSAFWGGMIYAVMPFFVYFSRVILPDPIAVGCIFISIMCMYRWTHESKKPMTIALYIGGIIFASLAILIKPTAIFYFLPLLYLFFRKYTFRSIVRWDVYVFFILAVIPFGLWRYWISLFPVGGPGFEWLITSVNTFEGQKVIFMRPAFFRWVFYERILILIMGGWTSGFLLLGSLRKLARPWLLYSLSASALIYIFTFQGGNVQHDYYQIIILPVLALVAGMGIGFLYDFHERFIPRIGITIIVIGVIAFSWIMSYERVKDMYAINGGLINNARIIKTLTPKDALVVTDTTGDTTLLYNAHRKGMPTFADALPELKKRGMEYFATSNAGAIEDIQKNHPEFEKIFSNTDITLYKL